MIAKGEPGEQTTKRARARCVLGCLSTFCRGRKK